MPDYLRNKPVDLLIDPELTAEDFNDDTLGRSLEDLYTDGGFGGQASDQALQDLKVTHIQTAIRGAQPDPNKFSLSDFDIQLDEAGHPFTLTCPQGQTVPVTPGRTTGWQARFETQVCATCPFQAEGRCRAQPQKRTPQYLLTFTTKQIRAAQRRKAYLAHRDDSHNLRSAVEASVRSVKHPFPAGKLPVRGQIRVTCMMIASAATTNLRRIQRWRKDKRKAGRTEKITQNQQNAQSETSLSSFFASAWAALVRQSCPGWLPVTVFGC